MSEADNYVLLLDEIGNKLEDYAQEVTVGLGHRFSKLWYLSQENSVWVNLKKNSVWNMY